MFISRRYSGNSHMALRRCLSEEFSTTMTWNCRGRNNMAKKETKVRVNHIVGSRSMSVE